MKQTDKEIVKVVQARIDGKETQRQNQYINSGWEKNYTGHAWNFNTFKYRVKPEPREYWIRKDQAQFESATAFSNKLMGFDRSAFIKVTEQL